jgi:hypothetical protein
MRFVREIALHYTGDGCLTWPFAKDRDGYGQIRVNGRTVVVSRYVCELVNGPAPTPKHEAAHSCGNGDKGCIAPDHLDWKTPSENNADKLIHGTINRGERNGKAKLSEAAVREIIAMKGKEMQIKLAEKFGVSNKTVSDIHTGRKWAWLSEQYKAGA